MKISPILAVIPALVSLCLSGCQRMRAQEPEHQQEHQTIVATSPKVEDVTITQPYVCQIRSRRHIEVRALQDGYLEKIMVKEGQPVKQNDVMFKILPTLYEARYQAEVAEARLADIKLENTKRLYEQQVVSIQDVYLHEAELKRAEAKRDLAKAELNFTDVKAQFDGIVDRLHEREGSLIKERDILTTLSDNAVMWVYFNVPEARYLEYMSSSEREKQDHVIELVLANHTKFDHTGKIGAIEANFNNETGNIAFRADFDNEYVTVNGQKLPKLRHGQTGTILIRHTVHDALVIPQRAVFEILAKRYVWVVGEDGVAHQHEIEIQHEQEDIFLVKQGFDKKGLDVTNKIVLEGVREVHEGDKVDYEFRKPEDALAHQKFHAE